MTQLINTKSQELLIRIIVLTFPITFIIGSAFFNFYLTIFFLYFFLNIKKIYQFFDKSIFFTPFIIWAYIFSITLINNYPLIQNYNFENILKSFFYLRIIILPLVIAYLINLYSDLKIQIFKTLIILITIISVDVIFQFNFGVNLIGLENTNHGMRNSSFFGSELISGSFISKFTTLSLASLFIYKNYNKKILKFFLLILPIIIIFGVLLSGERMAFLNAIFAIIIFIFLSRNIKILTLASVIVIILSTIIISSENLKKRYIYNTGAHLVGIDNAEGLSVFNNIFNNLDNGYHAKIFLNSLSLSRDNFITGNGIKSYRHRCFEIKKDNCSLHPHNFYLELLHDGGIILIMIYYYFFISILMTNFKSKINNHSNLSIIAVILTFLNPVQITGSIFSTWNAGMIFFIFGLALIPKKNEYK